MYIILFGIYRKFLHYDSRYSYRMLSNNIIFFLQFLSDINIYKATVPDRMHHLDLGLFHYQIDFTRELLKRQCDKSILDEVDRRLAAIPRFPGLKFLQVDYNQFLD